MSDSPRIYTRCPSCGNDTLTINDDKHLLCTWIECPHPTLIDNVGPYGLQLRTLVEATGFDDFYRALSFIKDQREMMDSVDWAMVNKPTPEEHAKTDAILKRAIVPELTTAIGDVLHDRIDWISDVPEALDLQRGIVGEDIRVIEFQGRYIHADDIAKLLGIAP